MSGPTRPTAVKGRPGRGPGGAHGWVLIIKAFSEPDAQLRESFLREAIAIGRRFRDPDIEFLGLAYLGGLFVLTDRVEEGLVLSDEALAALCAGELTELATVDEVFCGLLWACELVNDVARADQWMRAAAERMRRSNVVAAFCRAHYGGILTAAGRWGEAETELVEAGRHFDHGMSPRRDAAIIRLANLRVGRAGWRRPPGCSRDWSSIRTPFPAWPPSGWPTASWPGLGTCWSGPPAARTTRSRRSGRRPRWARCSPCWSRSTSRRGTSKAPGGSPGDWSSSPRRSGDRTSGRSPRSPRASSGWPAARGTPGPLCTRRWRGSPAPSCPWGWPGRAWSWPGPSPSPRPRSPSPRRGRPWRRSSGCRRPGTPTPPGRRCGRSAPPSAPAPRGSARSPGGRARSWSSSGPGGRLRHPKISPNIGNLPDTCGAAAPHPGHQLAG
jgi:hypothetical protein